MGAHVKNTVGCMQVNVGTVMKCMHLYVGMQIKLVQKLVMKCMHIMHVGTRATRMPTQKVITVRCVDSHEVGKVYVHHLDFIKVPRICVHFRKGTPRHLIGISWICVQFARGTPQNCIGIPWIDLHVERGAPWNFIEFLSICIHVAKEHPSKFHAFMLPRSTPRDFMEAPWIGACFLQGGYLLLKQ